MEILVVVGAVLIFLVVVAAFALLPSLVVWLGWGYVAVDVFGAPPLSFWQVFVALFALGCVGRMIFPSNSKSGEKASKR